MTTEAQTQANQQNALSSTGPRTEEGKARSARNAIQHGLAGPGAVLPGEEAELVAQRRQEWAERYRPGDAWETWLVNQAALESVRIERCQWHERVAREHAALLASTCWDETRRLAAEELFAKRTRRPERVARRLQQTPQGCACLLDRWLMLAGTLDRQGDWTDEQRTLALDLLGVPLDHRHQRTPLDPAPDSGADAVTVRRTVARVEIDRLRHRQTVVLAELDTTQRAAAERGEGIDDDPTVARLRRYERDARRRLLSALSMLEDHRAEQSAREDTAPEPVASQDLPMEPDTAAPEPLDEPPPPVSPTPAEAPARVEQAPRRDPAHRPFAPSLASRFAPSPRNRRERRAVQSLSGRA